MAKLSITIKKEFFELLPPTIFFFVALLFACAYAFVSVSAPTNAEAIARHVRITHGAFVI